jgi:hypothetical protein
MNKIELRTPYHINFVTIFLAVASIAIVSHQAELSIDPSHRLPHFPTSLFCRIIIACFDQRR